MSCIYRLRYVWWCYRYTYWLGLESVLLSWISSLWSGDRSGFGVCAQTLKNLPTMQETEVRSLGWEDPLEKEMGNGNPLQYSCLENPMDRGA